MSASNDFTDEYEPVSISKLFTKFYLMVICVILVAQLPLLLIHFKNLWRYPHYSHFPIIFIAFGMLVHHRLTNSSRYLLSYRILTGLMLVSGFTLTLYATIIYSPWIAMLGLICVLGGLMAGSVPANHKWNWLGIWLLLFLVLPIPLGLDQELILLLQFLSSKISSRVLDVIGVDHLMLGNVLKLPQEELFVDEACSGIQSFFALLSCTAIYLLCYSRSFVHSVILLVAVFPWSVIMNTLRICVIAIFNSRVTVDLSHGTPHEVLGGGIFIMTLILVISFDQFLYFLFGPVKRPNRVDRNPFINFWNSLIAGTSSSASMSRAKKYAIKLPLQPSVLIFASALGFGAVCFAQLIVCVPKGFQNFSGDSSAQKATVIALDISEETLPQSLNAFERAGFRKITRDPSSIYGLHSSYFVYKKPEINCILSFDFPYQERHDLRKCYRARDWQILEKGYEEIQPENEKALPYTRILLRNIFNEYGVVFYSGISSNGEFYTGFLKTADSVEKIQKKLTNIIPEYKKLETKADLTYYQFQLFTQTNREFKENELKQLEDLYVNARLEIMKTMYTSLSKETSKP